MGQIRKVDKGLKEAVKNEVAAMTLTKQDIIENVYAIYATPQQIGCTLPCTPVRTPVRTPVYPSSRASCNRGRFLIGPGVHEFDTASNRSLLNGGQEA